MNGGSSDSSDSQSNASFVESAFHPDGSEAVVDKTKEKSCKKDLFLPNVPVENQRMIRDPNVPG